MAAGPAEERNDAAVYRRLADGGDQLPVRNLLSVQVQLGKFVVVGGDRVHQLGPPFLRIGPELVAYLADGELLAFALRVPMDFLHIEEVYHAVKVLS